jgi:hypothetical protein
MALTDEIHEYTTAFWTLLMESLAAKYMIDDTTPQLRCHIELAVANMTKNWIIVKRTPIARTSEKKRALTGYNKFIQEFSAKPEHASSSTRVTDLAKIWKSLTEDDRQEFRDKAKIYNRERSEIPTEDAPDDLQA